eukprot:TRINITY_DN12928_c0_g2_i1.p1 TRINITY_DN12928_c0_g2~~TRINITY_DN12928_c0_g2_i1.p1  ORF type:complete len:158 (+),score=14.20 TRINITY_DN12928_c0_g2_i1:129-602(+)
MAWFVNKTFWRARHENQTGSNDWLVEELGDENVKNKALIGLYFSASWCRPCRVFTKYLLDFYHKVNLNNHLFEVVFVSKDNSRDEFFAYFTPMPWLALPWQDEARKELYLKYRISSIPTLIITDNQGKLVTRNGMSDVLERGSDALQHWQEEKEKLS